MADFIDVVRQAAKKKLLFLPHAIDQMSLPERMITINEVKKVIFQGEIREVYPDDARGHSCLIFRMGRSSKASYSCSMCSKG